MKTGVPRQASDHSPQKGNRMTFVDKTKAAYVITADGEESDAAKQAQKPRAHDPIVLIHLGYQRPYARFGYVDRATGVLTYTKLGPADDPQAVIPQSWLMMLRKQHPLYRRHVSAAEVNLATIGPKVEALFIDFGFQTTYNPDTIEVKAPYDPSTKQYGGEVLEATVNESGEVDVTLYPVKNPQTAEEMGINSAINEAGKIIKDYIT
jgi:hypothetical protein